MGRYFLPNVIFGVSQNIHFNYGDKTMSHILYDSFNHNINLIRKSDKFNPVGLGEFDKTYLNNKKTCILQTYSISIEKQLFSRMNCIVNNSIQKLNLK